MSGRFSCLKDLSVLARRTVDSGEANRSGSSGSNKIIESCCCYVSSCLKSLCVSSTFWTSLVFRTKWARPNIALIRRCVVSQGAKHALPLPQLYSKIDLTEEFSLWKCLLRIIFTTRLRKKKYEVSDTLPEITGRLIESFRCIAPWLTSQSWQFCT